MMTYKELKQMTTGIKYYEVWVGSKVCRDLDDGRYDDYQVVGLEFMSGDYYGNTCIVDLKKVDQKQSIFFYFQEETVLRGFRNRQQFVH